MCVCVCERSRLSVCVYVTVLVCEIVVCMNHYKSTKLVQVHIQSINGRLSC